MNGQSRTPSESDHTDPTTAIEPDVQVNSAIEFAAPRVLASESGVLRSPQQMVLDAVELAKRNLPRDASAEVQGVVAEILNLMEALLQGAQPVTRMAMAEFALHRVIKSPGDLLLAEKVVGNLRRNLGGTFWMWFTRFRVATPPHLDVIMGLTLSIVVFGGVFMLGGVNLLRTVGLSQNIASDNFLQSLVWLGAVGAFGSVISILTRLNDFAEKTQSSALLDFMNGFFKPVIGLAAAALFFVLIQSDILPLAFTTTQAATYAYVAIAFVAGFSERLFKDLVSIVERTAGAAGDRGHEFQASGGRALARERADES